MAKKKAAESGSKLTAKAAKAAKMAKNTERKAKKKAGKSKETRTADDDDQDLEAILEKVCAQLPRKSLNVNVSVVDAKRLGRPA